jgi:DNA adenine methylase
MTGRPDYFLYLLARCVKGSVRYNANGEFNQSPDNRRKGMRPDFMRSNIIGVSMLLKKKIIIKSKNYRDILNIVTENDLIYMDPPYQGVCGNKDTRYLSNIQFCEFITALENLNNKKIKYIVSYDGRTGNKVHGKKLPDHLNLHLIEIEAGRSSQETLLGRKSSTIESLYISPALNRIIKDKRKIETQKKQLTIEVCIQ